MNVMWKKVSTVTMLALTMWACENVGSVTQPQLEPMDEAHRALLVLEENGTKIVKETDFTVGVVTAVIGSQGGVLNLADRVVLHVPAGAAPDGTVFTMTKTDGDHLQVRLTATKLLPNDVGARGFSKPLKLTFDFSAAEQLPSDLSELSVFYIPLFEGAHEQPTVVDAAARKISADITHFSPYGVGWNE